MPNNGRTLADATEALLEPLARQESANSVVTDLVKNDNMKLANLKRQTKKCLKFQNYRVAAANKRLLDENCPSGMA